MPALLASESQDPALYQQSVQAAWDMIQSLSAAGSPPGGNPAVRQFQESWNSMRHLVAATLDFDSVSNAIASVVLDGLNTTGVYSTPTSYALTYLLFSLGDIQAIPGFSIPTRADEFPTWYAQFSDSLDALLLPIASNDFQVPSPQGTPPTNVAPVINPDGQLQDMIGGDVLFDDGSTVVVAPRTKSNVPLLAAGLGIAFGAGLLFLARRKKSRRRA